MADDVVPGERIRTFRDSDLPYRVDPLTGDVTYIVAARQGRPYLPSSDCPFCPGGVEAPAPYDVFAFPNRWPPIPDGRSEVVLYSPVHDATFWSLGRDGARKVIDLWAERSAVLGGRDDVHYVLVFENRGSEVGATISHPHGQIYAFDRIPPAPLAELVDGVLAPELVDEALVVGDHGDWRVWVPDAALWPYELRLAPRGAVGALTDEGCDRDGLAAALVDALARLDQLFDAPMPYLLWIHQRPTDGEPWPDARVHVHITPLHRRAGTPRYLASAEVGSGVFFNPVVPADAAAELRGLPGATG